jgi:hypothetical protein
MPIFYGSLIVLQVKRRKLVFQYSCVYEFGTEVFQERISIPSWLTEKALLHLLNVKIPNRTNFLIIWANYHEA